MRILLIDDDIVDRMSITRSLKATQENYYIDAAESASSAREKISAQDYDVILLDYLLPGINGVEFILEIKQLIENKNTAIVMISNMDDENLAIECLRAGAQDFILKSGINPIMLKMAIAKSVMRNELESALKTSFNQVKELAERDNLTGLANRFIFEESVALALKQRKRPCPITLFFIDVDNFKKINDTWGHTYGDQLLQRIATRIASCLRGGELLARIGGDEFAVLIDNVKSPAEANQAALRILQVMQSPFSFDGFNFYASLSIGITIQSRDSVDQDQLMSQADIAMHKAKGLGKAQICYFQESMQQEFIARVHIEEGLRHALEKQEFVMFYQPIVDPVNNAVNGYEALIRWTHNNAVVSPDKFIPVAQESHLIMDIGRWVIQDVFANHPPFRNDNCYLSINLSPLQLKDPELLHFIDEQAAHYHIKPNQIEFEITETAILDTSESIHTLLAEFVAHGYHLALDDFGTGFSSLSHLRDLPISTVKIDRSLLLTEPQDKREKMLRGLSELIFALDLDVVMEGIETEAQAQLCTALNIHRAQGYFYCKPQPLSIFVSVQSR
ncbi:two-component system response regulator [Simiduia aestuariiviva]|uniref:Diguanylate cyclase (GGDEF)-like protein n=1 Tax=Simiduia aestuariiviva TaxID=1510459 RepID=A0A839UPI2_9GAMM|nr:GGDEF domain-containing response regulator [Simiduia aestuariiviva]MBB3167337.1 diguanylate cyclase (GGDEF)-like protein [Simiduia aestuariiviva]